MHVHYFFCLYFSGCPSFFLSYKQTSFSSSSCWYLFFARFARLSVQSFSLCAYSSSFFCLLWIFVYPVCYSSIVCLHLYIYLLMFSYVLFSVFSFLQFSLIVLHCLGISSGLNSVCHNRFWHGLIYSYFTFLGHVSISKGDFVAKIFWLLIYYGIQDLLKQQENKKILLTYAFLDFHVFADVASHFYSRFTTTVSTIFKRHLLLIIFCIVPFFWYGFRVDYGLQNLLYFIW